MRYLLRHITQLSLLTVILLSVGAVCMWIPSFIHEAQWWKVLITMVLTLVNTFSMMLLCFNGNLTKMLDLFSGFCYLIIFSALRPWHTIWQAQVIILLMMLAVYVFQHIDRHQVQSAAEHTFLIAVLVALASYWLPSVLFLLIGVIILLSLRQSFDGQSFLAILFGLALVAIYATLLSWMGWITPTWLHFFATESLYYWLPIAALALATIINFTSYTGEAIWRGITFIVYVVVCLVLWLVLTLGPLPIISM